MWYYSKNNQQLGPVGEDQLQSMFRSAALTGSSLVWKDGMSDWKPVKDVPELAVLLTSAIPTPSLVSPPSLATPPAAESPNPYSAPVSQLNRSYSTQPAMGASMGTPINSGGILAFAIVTTVLCCMPTGVVGIVYAAQINSKMAQGDHFGAAESARLSKMWSWIGLGIGLVVIVLYLLLVVASVASQ